jgi:hypothetical protein
MKQKDGTTVVQLSRGALQWTFPGAQVVLMRREMIQRSPFLMNLWAVFEQSAGEVASVSLPLNVDLQAWLQFVAIADAQCDTDKPSADPESLLKVLLVRFVIWRLFRNDLVRRPCATHLACPLD